MSSEPMHLPDEIVERAAMALQAFHWWNYGLDEVGEADPEWTGPAARAVLAAALDGADVEVRARVRIETTLLPPRDSEPPIVTWLTWCSAAAAEEEAARCRITHPGSSYFVEQQLVITW